MPRTRIEQDPTTEIMPDFESEAFRQLFTPLTTQEKPLEDIVADAKRAWEEQHQQRVEDVMRPGQYAVNKVKNLEPAEMWYWTVEGCEDAKQQDTSASSSAMTLAQGEHGLIFTPAAAHKPSPKVKADADLTYLQMMIAKAGLIQSMLKEPNWPNTHVNSFAGLFLIIDNHPLRRLPHGDEALVIYVAEARREWHDALKSTDDDVEAFDISMVNEERLARIHGQYSLIPTKTGC
ncbi:hypothetical protein FA13DRAFT_1777864 [Coprinellus micaceus]|uniref:Uncharacterized protein n=1 Tax=Coprinellus micaceus TaxID=71717 RepID=A0A4Y7STB4_COPMI|nr:hypothetical protein FA13DRAFT_1777864 [Coprinellus micaceus]